MDPLVLEDVQAWREDHPENLDNPEQDEGAGPSLQVLAGQRARHGGRLQADGAAALPAPFQPPQPPISAPLQPYQPQPCAQEWWPVQV